MAVYSWCLKYLKYLIKEPILGDVIIGEALKKLYQEIVMTCTAQAM